MHIAQLANNENTELLEELKRIYILDTYKYQIDNFLYKVLPNNFPKLFIIDPDSEFYRKFSIKVLYTINRIFLDLVLSYIITEKISEFILKLNMSTIVNDIYIKPIYMDELNLLFITEYDSITDHSRTEYLKTHIQPEISHILTSYIIGIIMYFYSNNQAVINLILMNTIYNMNCSIQYIIQKKIDRYVIELDGYCRPILMYTLVNEI